MRISDSPLVPFSQRRVLLVEDDRQLAMAIMSALQDHGFAVECAYTGHTGLKRACDDGFDVVVLDRMLPDIDGLSILTTLRNIGKKTPVLFSADFQQQMSAYEDCAPAVTTI